MKKKLTPWFPPSVKPARQGYYNASLYCHPNYYRYWNGKKWSVGDISLEAAAKTQIECLTSLSGIYWRGLAVKP